MCKSVFIEFRLMSSVASNRCPFTTFLSLGNRKKIWWVWRLLQLSGAVFGSKLLHMMWSVCGRTVVVQDPVTIPPFFWSFSVNWFTQMSQELHVEFLVICLPMGSILVVYNALRIKKHASNMTFVLFRTWRPFFGHGDVGPFHCDDCCFVSGSYS